MIKIWQINLAVYIFFSFSNLDSSSIHDVFNNKYKSSCRIMAGRTLSH
jgi:hypothetical protein